MASGKHKKINVRRTVVTLVAIYVVCHLLYSVGSMLDLKMQQHQLARDLEAAYAEQAALTAELEYMRSEDAMEEIAREQLGLIKDGEILIQWAGSGQTQ